MCNPGSFQPASQFPACTEARGYSTPDAGLMLLISKLQDASAGLILKLLWVTLDQSSII